MGRAFLPPLWTLLFLINIYTLSQPYQISYNFSNFPPPPPHLSARELQILLSVKRNMQQVGSKLPARHSIRTPVPPISARCSTSIINTTGSAKTAKSTYRGRARAPPLSQIFTLIKVVAGGVQLLITSPIERPIAHQPVLPPHYDNVK